MVCEFAISIDTIDVQAMQEDVYYLGRMDKIDDITSAKLRGYMNIFEIKNPRYYLGN